MQALYCKNNQITLCDNYPLPQCQADEAVVRVTLAGICATDLEMARGYVPGFAGVLGHEFVGIVESSCVEGWLGKRVVASINIGCQQCAICQKFGPEHCPDRQVLGIHDRDGVFAEYVAVPLRNLHLVPDHLSDEQAVFTEPLAAALQIRQQVPIRPSSRVAVIGPGRLGLLVAQVLQLGCGDVTVLGRRESSLTLPASWGLQTGLTPDFASRQFDFVVEVTGNSAGFTEAVRLVRPMGTIVLKSTFAGNNQLNLSEVVVGEINVIGSRCGQFTPTLRLLASGSIQTAPFITAEYALSNGVEAIEKAAQPGVLKVLIRP